MTSKLTDSAIRSATRRAADTGKVAELIDADCVGLRLRVTSRGLRRWVVACRDARGSLRRFPVGEYPEMGISAARRRAAVVRADVKGGADPIAEARRRRQMGREEREGIGTLAALVDLYGEKRGGSLKSWQEYRRGINAVFARLMRTPLTSITVIDLQLAADRWPARQSAASAVRYLRPVLKWASEPGRGYVPSELGAIKPPAPPVRRDRVLSRDELARLLPRLRESESPYGPLFKFLLLTLARRDEAAGAKWGDMDLAAGTWRISATKNGQPHVVPLSRQALDLLYARRPENADTLGFVFSTSAGTRLGNFDRATKAIQKASETAGWTRHDLRRTGATLLGEMGELPDIIEAALNHTAIHSQIAAIYNRSRYRPQVAAALQRLADHLDEIEFGDAEIRAGR